MNADWSKMVEELGNRGAINNLLGVHSRKETSVSFLDRRSPELILSDFNEMVRLLPEESEDESTRWFVSPETRRKMKRLEYLGCGGECRDFQAGDDEYEKRVLCDEFLGYRTRMCGLTHFAAAFGTVGKHIVFLK